MKSINIENSIKKLIDDISKNHTIEFNEYDLQARLYYYLMKEFEAMNDKDIWRIRLEYKPYEKQKNKRENWEQCFRDYCKNEPDEIKFDGKEGKYDLVVLDKTNGDILHAIEIKNITSCAKSLKHRGYEDIYVLTKLLRDNFPGSKSYIVIFAKASSKDEKMKIFLENVQRAYENAEVYCRYIVLDNFNNR